MAMNTGLSQTCYLKRVGCSDLFSDNRIIVLKDGQTLLLGRAPDADVVLPSPLISRYHAVLKRNEQGNWTVTDNSSVNGVQVNDIKLTSLVAHVLTNGDIIHLGPSTDLGEQTQEFVWTFHRRLNFRKRPCQRSPKTSLPKKQCLHLIEKVEGDICSPQNKTAKIEAEVENGPLAEGAQLASNICDSETLNSNRDSDRLVTDECYNKVVAETAHSKQSTSVTAVCKQTTVVAIDHQQRKSVATDCQQSTSACQQSISAAADTVLADCKQSTEYVKQTAAITADCQHILSVTVLSESEHCAKSSLSFDNDLRVHHDPTLHNSSMVNSASTLNSASIVNSALMINSIPMVNSTLSSDSTVINNSMLESIPIESISCVPNLSPLSHERRMRKEVEERYRVELEQREERMKRLEQELRERDETRRCLEKELKMRTARQHSNSEGFSGNMLEISSVSVNSAELNQDKQSDEFDAENRSIILSTTKYQPTCQSNLSQLVANAACFTDNFSRGLDQTGLNQTDGGGNQTGLNKSGGEGNQTDLYQSSRKDSHTSLNQFGGAGSQTGLNQFGGQTGLNHSGGEERLRAAAREAVLADIADLMETELQCGICNELFIRPMMLNCAHSFCTVCIQRWTRIRKECPACRTRVTTMQRSIVLDSYIDRMCAQLSTEHQLRRRQLIDERSAEAAALIKKKPRTRTAEVVLLEDVATPSDRRVTRGARTSRGRQQRQQRNVHRGRINDVIVVSDAAEGRAVAATNADGRATTTVNAVSATRRTSGISTTATNAAAAGLGNADGRTTTIAGRRRTGIASIAVSTVANAAAMAETTLAAATTSDDTIPAAVGVIRIGGTSAAAVSEVRVAVPVAATAVRRTAGTRLEAARVGTTIAPIPTADRRSAGLVTTVAESIAAASFMRTAGMMRATVVKANTANANAARTAAASFITAGNMATAVAAGVRRAAGISSALVATTANATIARRTTSATSVTMTDNSVTIGAADASSTKAADAIRAAIPDLTVLRIAPATASTVAGSATAIVAAQTIPRTVATASTPRATSMPVAVRTVLLTITGNAVTARPPRAFAVTTSVGATAAQALITTRAPAIATTVHGTANRIVAASPRTFVTGAAGRVTNSIRVAMPADVPILMATGRPTLTRSNRESATNNSRRKASARTVGSLAAAPVNDEVIVIDDENRNNPMRVTDRRTARSKTVKARQRYRDW